MSADKLQACDLVKELGWDFTDCLTHLELATNDVLLEFVKLLAPDPSCPEWVEERSTAGRSAAMNILLSRGVRP